MKQLLPEELEDLKRDFVRSLSRKQMAELLMIMDNSNGHWVNDFLGELREDLAYLATCVADKKPAG